MEEDKKATNLVLTALFGGAALLISGATLGSCIGRVTEGSRFERDAVEFGHAEYIINKKFEREWRWLPPCKGKEGPK